MEKATKFHRVRRIADVIETAWHPIPLQYWVEGVLLESPEVDGNINMLRMTNSKNPEGRLGIFKTSKIVSIDQNKITTKNSVYEIEEIEADNLSCYANSN